MSSHERHLSSSSVSSTTPLKKTHSNISTYQEDERSQPKLKLFESPLAHDRRKYSITPTPPSAIHNISGPINIARKQSYDELAENQYDDRKIDPFPKDDAEEEMFETPEFRRYEETTNMELFYDLFFVANLTTFNDVHDVNEIDALKSYAGFFCILWFLWLQVSLYDVRFVTDSVLERIGKACQFGVMIGLAIVGPDFNSSDQKPGAFRSLAIILMFSRLVLSFQYSVILYHVWYYKNSKTPLFLVVVANCIAAMIYFATFFGFTKETSKTGKVFIVWYIAAIMETAVNIAISSKWKVLSFRGSHLVQRMTLLTLIILGEGVIGVSKSIADIAEQEESWTAPLILTIVSAVGIIYFLYMLYFDWLNRSHFGSMRQQIWAFLHFPFHLALVFLVEGAAQFIRWRKVVEVINLVSKKYVDDFKKNPAIDSLDLKTRLTNITEKIFEKFSPEFTQTFTDTEKALFNIGNATFKSIEQLGNITTLFSTVQDSLFDNFGIDPPESDNAVTDPNEEWNENLGVLALVFTYFFLASGVTLILMNILNILSRPKMTRADKIRIAVNFVLSITLAGLAGISNTNSGFAFAQSAWVLPIVAGTYFFVMLLGYTKLLW
ncbi:2a9b570c-7041-41a4-adcf-290909a1c915 [Sclerotinia trifoliorum]|uniref:2a9b570c-7041-41a4-adcf-290909a1c915 n=1 Tax=Sclerotinia trifoliorum TaxID=28548 RepID=A0A8H2VT50_9HELO|nr:2a9b570c-7041-41a4-adcf-290909a1c915 [Sclerotinia trifoliorum]